jgi:putative nucleotidyltransferase with HDIG domain
LKTLIVDDELVGRKTMQKIMESYGECEAVDSGKVAISAFKKAWENWTPFDLITLDVSMPDMDGTEVLRELKEMEKEKGMSEENQIKVLMVTSHTDRDTVITCIQAECDDYVVKPYDKKTIIEKIEKIKSGKRLTRAEMEDVMSSPAKIEKDKIKTLIVDDELVSRKTMQKIMESFGECEAVDSGKAAISAFKKAWENWTPFDLITLDVSMPDMDGTEVLYEIREIEKEKGVPKEKQIKILMVTSHSDKDTITTCIQAECDDYIVKPFDKETISKRIEKLKSGERLTVDRIDDIQSKVAETKSSVIEKIIFHFKRGDITLPSPPQTSIKFKEMVNQAAKIEAIAAFLKQDVAVSFKLISVANSTYYGGISEIETLDQAISRLGLDTTRKYVEAISHRALYVSADKKILALMDKLWKHSLSCAYASQIITEVLKMKLPDFAFTMGLFHDIGKLFLLQVFGELEIKGQLGEEVSRIEMFNDFDTHHGKFGAALLKKWKFPALYSQIAMYHNNLEGFDHRPQGLLVVHFANILVKSMGYKIGRQSEIDLVKSESARILKIDNAMIADIKSQVKENMEEVGSFFL